MKIITVDDEPVSRQLLRQAVTSFGHEVIEMEGGHEAWVAYRQQGVHIIISDWVMPSMDGLELCKRVRAERSPRYTYFILVTTREGKKRYLEAMDAGVDDFITKPFDVDMLAARLRVAQRIISLKTDLQTLEGLLPICAYCKKIRNDESRWEVLETYISKRTEASFSHGVCPECYTKHMLPELERLRNNPKVPYP